MGPYGRVSLWSTQIVGHRLRGNTTSGLNICDADRSGSSDRSLPRALGVPSDCALLSELLISRALCHPFVYTRESDDLTDAERKLSGRAESNILTSHWLYNRSEVYAMECI